MYIFLIGFAWGQTYKLQSRLQAGGGSMSSFGCIGILAKFKSTQAICVPLNPRQDKRGEEVKM